jgi:glycosyltransferase involved in cell wall biosynthesis
MTILTTNVHTPYLYLLSKTGDLYHVIGGWNYKQRPKPENIILIEEDQAMLNLKRRNYDIFIAHNQFKDLKYIVKALRYKTPTILVFHGKKQRAGYSGSKFYYYLKALYTNLVTRNLLKLGPVHFVFIQPAVKWSYGFPGTVIEPGIDIKEMPIWKPKNKEILIVGNDLHRHYFAHEFIFELINSNKYEVRIVGKNTKFPSKEAENFDELKSYYQNSYLYVNVLREPESGYNLSLLEAMAVGMPIVTLDHPESPIRNGYNGLTFETIHDMFEKIDLLLKNPTMARELGKNARITVEKFFPIELFIEKWKKVFKEVRLKSG